MSAVKKSAPSVKRTQKSKTEIVNDAVLDENVVDSNQTIDVPAENVIRPALSKRKEVSLDDLVYVQSCFHGNLFYKSKRNGSIVEWQRFGEDQPMDVDELMYMRNTQPTFFKEQWIRLVGDNADDVFAFLRLDRYCKNNLKFDDFDDVFAMDPDTIKSVVREFTPSLKDSFARRAMELIEAEELTDLKTIKAIEATTSCKLIQ